MKMGFMAVCQACNEVWFEEDKNFIFICVKCGGTLITIDPVKDEFPQLLG